jgi:hypothetical protein
MIGLFSGHEDAGDARPALAGIRDAESKDL